MMKRVLFAIGILLAPVLALAQGGEGACALLGGGFCDSGSGDAVIQSGLSTIGKFFVGIAAGSAVLFGVVGGMQLLLSFGDESKITKGRNSLILSLAGFSLVLASQAVVSITVNNVGDFTNSNNPFIDMMSVAVSVMVGALNAVFILIMVLTGVRMVIAQGKSDEFSKARRAFVYAFVGAFFVNLSRAFVQGLLNSSFSGSA